jgi:hypothetical protein
MSESSSKLARGIKAFVENPITNLVKGVLLMMIGFSDASQTFRDDVSHGHFRLGHGLVIIGIFSVLGALPHLIDSLDAGVRYLEFLEKKKEAKNEADKRRE